MFAGLRLLPAIRAGGLRAARRAIRRPAALLALAACGFATSQPAPDPTVVVIDRAVSVAADGPAFPASSAPTPVSLPDRWDESRPGYSGVVWYRTGFRFVSIAPADDLISVYVGNACSNLQLQLNGYLIYSGGRMAEPLGRNCGRPLLVALPAALLRTGDNVLDLRLAGYQQGRVGSVQGAATLSRIEIGSQSALREAHGGAWLWNVTWPRAAALALLGIGCILLAVGWLHRHEVYFAYLGWLCLAWAAFSLVLAARDMPWPNDVTEFMLVSAWPVLLALAVQFFLSFGGVRSRTIEALAALQWVMLPLSLVIAGPEWLFDVARAWYSLIAFELAAVMVLYLGLARRQRPQDFGGMALLVGASVLVLGVELSVQWGALRPPPVSPAMLFVPLALAALGARLFLMFARALRETEKDRDRVVFELQRLHATTDERVEALTAQRVGQFTEQERKRIAADLHDDLGAKLLTIVHSTDSRRLPDLAREALEEMRLSVRGLAGKAVRLEDAVADWRAEIVGRLEQAGIKARWGAATLPEAAVLPARTFMQLTRILRESISNVIKHSGAKHCRVRCEVVDETLVVNIKDDGLGIPEHLQTGQGMATMKRRAKAMSGQCLVESYPGRGVVISLTVPI